MIARFARLGEGDYQNQADFVPPIAFLRRSSSLGAIGYRTRRSPRPAAKRPGFRRSTRNEYRKAPEVTRKRMYLETMDATHKIITSGKFGQGIPARPGPATDEKSIA